MPLEYPVTKPYTLAHLTLYVSLGSVIAILGLVVLNFVLQGYEVVTVLRPDPNVTNSQWWAPDSLAGWRSPKSCDPVSLSRQSTFRTNSSLFAYDLRSTFDSAGKNILGATPYLANPLDSCIVDGILVNINVNRQMMKFDTPIRCTGSHLPYSLSLTSSFVVHNNPYYNDINTYYNSNKAARANLEVGSHFVSLNASSLTNIVATLDALSTDLQVAMTMAVNSFTGSRPTVIITGSLWACPGDSNTSCNPGDMTMSIPITQTDYSNGSTVISDGPGPFVGLIERPLSNMLVALKDAYLVDVGNIEPSNSLLNKDQFDKVMQIDPSFTAAIQASNEKLCSSGLGCLGGMSWVQRLLSSDPTINVTIPSVLPGGTAPAVIRYDYLCPTYKLKSTGSLITSIFIGTWSMYTALWGVFRFFGPMLEARYGKGKAEDSVDEPKLGYSDPSIPQTKMDISSP